MFISLDMLMNFFNYAVAIMVKCFCFLFTILINLKRTNAENNSAYLQFLSIEFFILFNQKLDFDHLFSF